MSAGRVPPPGGRGPDRSGSGPPPPPPWVPKTELGRKVHSGEITTMGRRAAHAGCRCGRPQIVDKLLPMLHDEVLDVNMVQRMTDSGRRFKFAVTVVVGNGDGYVGLGRAKGREVGPTIRRAIDRAKLTIIEVYRGCGSWECGCGRPHTVPFQVARPLRLGRRHVQAGARGRRPRRRRRHQADPAVRRDHRRLGVHRRPHEDDGQLRPGARSGRSRRSRELKVRPRTGERLKIVRGAIGTSILPPKEEGPPAAAADARRPARRPGGRGRPGRGGPGRGGPGRGGPGTGVAALGGPPRPPAGGGSSMAWMVIRVRGTIHARHDIVETLDRPPPDAAEPRDRSCPRPRRTGG